MIPSGANQVWYIQLTQHIEYLMFSHCSLLRSSLFKIIKFRWSTSLKFKTCSAGWTVLEHWVVLRCSYSIADSSNLKQYTFILFFTLINVIPWNSCNVIYVMHCNVKIVFLYACLLCSMLYSIGTIYTHLYTWRNFRGFWFGTTRILLVYQLAFRDNELKWPSYVLSEMGFGPPRACTCVTLWQQPQWLKAVVTEENQWSVEAGAAIAEHGDIPTLGLMLSIISKQIGFLLVGMIEQLTVIVWDCDSTTKRYLSSKNGALLKTFGHPDPLSVWCDTSGGFLRSHIPTSPFHRPWTYFFAFVQESPRWYMVI